MNKVLLSILMVAGTSIGGGMIALPALMGVYGYLSAVSTLVIVWLINITIALLYLEANSYFPTGAGLISMSRALLGRIGEIIAWVVTFVFFYSLLTAYTAGASDIIAILGTNLSLPVNTHLSLVVISTIMGLFLYFGFSAIAKLNQYIVLSLMLSFIALVTMLLTHINTGLLSAGVSHFSFQPLPIVFTSFGFLAILPSMRQFLAGDVRKIKLSIVIGSLIPLLIYVLWVTIAMGYIPIEGAESLSTILHDSNMVKATTNALADRIQTNNIQFIIKIFVGCAMFSSFVGTSIALFDSLADGLNIQKNRLGKLTLIALIFVPIITVSLLKPALFLTGLTYAGICAVVLFALYPVLMTWSGRYIKQMQGPYRALANRPTMLVLIGFSILIMVVQLF